MKSDMLEQLPEESTLEGILSGNKKQLIAIGKELWGLRKWVYWVYDNDRLNINETEDKQKLLEKINNMSGIKMHGANTIEYNFGGYLTRLTLECFVHAKYVKGVDSVLKDSIHFKYAESFFDNSIIFAYLDLRQVKKAKNLVVRLIKQPEDWGTYRALPDLQSIAQYMNAHKK